MAHDSVHTGENGRGEYRERDGAGRGREKRRQAQESSSNMWHVGAKPVCISRSSFGSRASVGHFDDTLDLDGDLVRQGAHADRGSRMASTLAENLDEQVRAAVDDLWLSAEIGLCIDHTEHLYHARYPIDRPHAL